jgi:hypothetical protein
VHCSGHCANLASAGLTNQPTFHRLELLLTAVYNYVSASPKRANTFKLFQVWRVVPGWRLIFLSRYKTWGAWLRPCAPYKLNGIDPRKELSGRHYRFSLRSALPNV